MSARRQNDFPHCHSLLFLETNAAIILIPLRDKFSLLAGRARIFSFPSHAPRIGAPLENSALAKRRRKPQQNHPRSVSS
jgi:hypothetical protein